MPTTLLLRLPAPGSGDTEWLIIDEAGIPATARQRGPLSLAAAVARSSRVVAVAPATQVLLAEPELPPGGGVKLARAVPFALEDQLTEDVDRLVFALGRRRPGGGTPVAVVARTVIEGWLADLKTAGIEPAALYADMSLLPDNPGQTVLWYERGRLSVRRPGRLPFAVELAPVTDALIVAGVIADPLADSSPDAPLPAEAAVPENVLLYATRDDWAEVQAEFEKVGDRFASMKVQLLPDGPLPWLARDLAGTDAVNLLQGEFAPTTDHGARWRRWRTVAALAAALLVVHVAAEAIQLRQVKRDNAVLETQMAQVFSAAMPGEPLQDPRRQMQARLDRIRHSGPGPQNFLRMLQSLGEAVSATPQTTVDSLSYHENSLEMKVTAPSLAALAQLSQLMVKQGMNADIQSSTPAGEGVEAHMQVRGAGAKSNR